MDSLPLPVRQEGNVTFRDQHGASTSNNANRAGSDDDEDVCRICRMPGEADSPLYYPCACSGSIKYVHEGCLLQWLSHSNTRSCEVCKHPFSFSPVYAADAPSRLPLSELLLGLSNRAIKAFRFLSRLTLVVCIWLLLIPYVTCWFWRFAFARSVPSLQALIAARMTPLHVVTDCVYGSFLSAAIVFVFLGATSIREYFRQVQGEEAARRGNQVAPAVPPPVLPPAQPALQNAQPPWAVAAFNDGLREGQALVARHMRQPEGVEQADHVPNDHAMQDLGHPFGGIVQEDDMEPNEELPFNELIGMQGPVAHLFENAITVLGSNAIFLGITALLPFTLGRLVLSFVTSSGTSKLVVEVVQQLFQTLPLGWLSALATANNYPMRNFTPIGATSSLLSDAGLKEAGNGSVSAACSAKEGLEAVVAKASPLLMSLVANSTDVSMGSSGSSLQNFSFNMNSSADPVSQLVGNATGVPVNLTFKVLHKGSEASLLGEGLLFSDGSLSDFGTLLVGYLLLMLVGGAYGALLLFTKYQRGAEVVLHHGVAGAVVEAVPEAARQVLAAVRYTGTTLKVALLLSVELGAFPLACGWWLDVCTLQLLGSSWGARMAFLQAAPLTTTVLHWLVGMVYMLQLSVFVSLMREVLRPGVLFFLRDPADPNYNPFRDLVEDPLLKHARRIALSVVLYGALIVLLVFLPVQLALLLKPALFPLNLRFSDPFMEVPADMLLFHICIPFTIEHFRPRATIKWALHKWFSFVGQALDLATFLLPRPGVEAPEQGGGQPGGLQEEEGPSEPQQHERESSFSLRVFVLVLAAWLTLLQINALAVLIPVSVGRSVFHRLARLPLAQAAANCNDMYAFGTGCYFLWGGAVAVRHLARYIRSHDVTAAALLVVRWALTLVKLQILLVLWVGVVPLLVGLLFELLLVIPLRVPVDESPVFLLYQDWALGLLFLKLWTRLIMLGQAGPFGETAMRQKFEQVRQSGLTNLKFRFAFSEIVAPVVLQLLTGLCVPYVVARGVVPLLGFPPMVSSAVFRLGWSSSVLAWAVWKSFWKVQKAVKDLHDAIRDDRYLVGRRLHNFGHMPRKADSAPAVTATPLLEGSEEGPALGEEITSQQDDPGPSQQQPAFSQDSGRTQFASGQVESFSSESSFGDALFGVDADEVTSRCSRREQAYAHEVKVMAAAAAERRQRAGRFLRPPQEQPHARDL